jgi:hypothetical protein
MTLYKLDIDQNNVSQLSAQHGPLNEAGLLLACYWAVKWANAIYDGESCSGRDQIWNDAIG